VFDLTQCAGGIIYIEFMMHFLFVACAVQFPGLSEYTDNVRILEAVAESGLLSTEDVESLTHAYKVYRSKYHRVALANEKPLIGSGCYEVERTSVIKVWNQLMLDA